MKHPTKHASPPAVPCFVPTAPQARGADLFRHLPLAARDCSYHLLHEAPIGRIELCPCGTALIAVGGLSLQLPVGALVEVHTLLDDALTRLAEADDAARLAARRGDDN